MVWRVSKSQIHGEGMFSSRKIPANTKIDTGIEYYFGFFPVITRGFGSMINHSYEANSKLIYNKKENVWDVFSNMDIPESTEITLNYRDTPWFIEGPKNWYV